MARILQPTFTMNFDEPMEDQVLLVAWLDTFPLADSYFTTRVECCGDWRSVLDRLVTENLIDLESTENGSMRWRLTPSGIEIVKARQLDVRGALLCEWAG